MKKHLLLLCVAFAYQLTTGFAQNISTTNASINTCNGSATVDATYAADSLTSWSWTDSIGTTLQSGGLTFNNLCVGNYYFAFHRNSNPSAAFSYPFSITSLCTSFSASITPTYISAIGACDGSAAAVTHNGSAPFTYSWSNSVTTVNNVNLCAGNYTVSIVDANGCSTSSSIGIAYTCNSFSISAIQINGASSNAICDGTAKCIIHDSIGGIVSGNYTFLWSNSSTDTTITNLCIGHYSVTATSPSGCTDTASVDIVLDACHNFATTATSTNSSTPSTCNGTATLNITGGTPTYSILWTNGATSSTITNICSGSYTATVTDANGCTTHPYVYVGSSNNLMVSAVITDSDSSNCTGSATIYPSFGVAPYHYAFSNGDSTHSVSGLCPGIYSVLVTDSASSFLYSFVIANPANTYTNTPYQGVTSLDTLSNAAVETCGFDYTTVDSISIASYTQNGNTVTVNWMIYSASLDTTISEVYSINGNGIYSFVLSLYCSNPTRTAPVFVKAIDQLNLTGTTGIINYDKKAITVYPNPATSIINITYAASSKIYSYKIYDVMGKVVKTKEITNDATNTINIDDLNTGVYMLNIIDENKSIVKRFIKQ